MRTIEQFINWLSDMDWQWYPFLFLRPEKHEKMTTPRLLKMLIWYFPIFMALSVVMIFISPTIYIGTLAPPISTLLMFLAYFMISFFFLMRLVVATAWNSRAERIDKRKRKPKYDGALSRLVDADALPLARDFTNPTERTVPFVSDGTE